MNRLTKAMHQQWVEDGYLPLKNIIPKNEAAGYLEAANEVIRCMDGFDFECPHV